MKNIFLLVLVFTLIGCKEELIKDQISAEIVIKEEITPKLVEPKEVLIPKRTERIAPDLVGLTNWQNSEGFESLEELRGKVVMVNFWTYGCINCVRTLPYVQKLYNDYGDDDFVVLGLHRPEFKNEYNLKNLQWNIAHHGLTYPIAQDNEALTWKAYKNRYWPAQYIIDQEGYIVYEHKGEGAYEKMDEVVRGLLGKE